MRVDVFAVLPLQRGEVNLTVHKFVPDEFPEVEVEPHRVEIPHVAADEQQYKIVVLDAEDSFDVIVENHLGDREIIWSSIK